MAPVFLAVACKYSPGSSNVNYVMQWAYVHAIDELFNGDRGRSRATGSFSRVAPSIQYQRPDIRETIHSALNL